MKGMKTGGRVRGTPNRATRIQREAIAASGQTPLDYLLGVMRDGSLGVAERLEAAKAATPYVHARLSAVNMTTNVHTLDDAELESARRKVSAIIERAVAAGRDSTTS